MTRKGAFLIVLCVFLILVGTGCRLPFAALRPTEEPATAPPAQAAPTRVLVATPPPQTTPQSPARVTPQSGLLVTPETLPQPAPTLDVGPAGTPGTMDSWDDGGSAPAGGGKEEEAGPPPKATAASGRSATSLTLLNAADRSVCYVFISATTEDSWGDDWLGGEDVIAPGGSRTFDLPAGAYDLMALDCDEEALDRVDNIYLEGAMEWTVGEGASPPRATASPQPTAAAPPPAPASVYPTPTPASVSAFLCCGTTPGETGTIWSLNYPANWYVTLLPDNPQQFYGAIFTDPGGQVSITFIPGSNTEPGHELDTGNVDDFLDRFTAIRQREEVGFEEIVRNPIPAVPSGRLWAGTWGSGPQRGWEVYLVTVDPLFQVAPGLPQGYLTMYGFRAPSRDWNNAERTFDQMWNSMRVKRFGGNEEGLPPREPNQKPIMIRWCPKCCDWVAVDADRDDWACPTCGHETYLWETPCE